MGGRRSSRQRRRCAKVAAESDANAKASSPPSSGSSGVSSDRKIPQHQEEEEVAATSSAWAPADRRAMRRNLLTLIHRHYLDAIARLPAADLRASLARGLLVGGHCYGPLSPVHNILLNSIWYAAAFPRRAPAADRIDVHVISADGLARLCRRSLDGLVASLRHCCPSLSSSDDALWHLMAANADLPAAIALANRTSETIARAAMLSHAHAAFQAAAEAARHPEPAAFASSAAASLAVEHQVVQLLRVRHVLSPPDIEHLVGLLLLPPPAPSDHPLQPPVMMLSPGVLDLITSHKNKFRDTQELVLKVVGMALRDYARRSGEQFILHSVCGANLLDIQDGSGDCYHINFLAYRQESGPTVDASYLFFTEAIVPASDDTVICLCVLVDPSADIGRCFDCETNKRKVVHPAYDEYLGRRDLVLDEVGNDSDFLNPLDVDYIFFDADRDNAFANYLAEIIDCGMVVP